MNWLNKSKPTAPAYLPGPFGPKWDISGPLEAAGTTYQQPSYTPYPPDLSTPTRQYNYPPYEQYASSPTSPFQSVQKV